MADATVNVAFIGLGVMGRPMALNLVRSDSPLWVHSRRTESMTPLAAAGATACASAGQAARAADLIVLMVPGTAEVEQVLFGPQGVLTGARPGSVVVDMGDTSPASTLTFAARLEARGVEMLDAPVSGGETEAVTGALSILAGGKPEMLERARPLLERLGNKIIHAGARGSGQLAKACNRIVASLALQGVAEAFHFARANGVDPGRVREALMGGFAGSRVLDQQGKRMLERDFRPGLKTRLHQEDLRMILETAHRAGLALPGTSLAAQYMNALTGGREGDGDSAALIAVMERLNPDR
jgi:2-hydroxy-3-oxopropionate reductase